MELKRTEKKYSHNLINYMMSESFDMRAERKFLWSQRFYFFRRENSTWNSSKHHTHPEVIRDWLSEGWVSIIQFIQLNTFYLSSLKNLHIEQKSNIKWWQKLSFYYGNNFFQFNAEFLNKNLFFKTILRVFLYNVD